MIEHQIIDTSVWNTIEDPDLQQYAKETLPGMAESVVARMEDSEGTQAFAARGRDLAQAIASHIPTWNTDKIRKAYQKVQWEIFCKVEDGKGVPESRWLDVFNEDGVGTQIAGAAIVAAFAGVGTVVGGGIGTFVGSQLGISIQEFVEEMVCEELDQWTEGHLTKYCTLKETTTT